MSEAVKRFRSDEVIYIALLGDPELYLPEGKGLFPSACNGGELSSYRINVPNCRTKSGSLGSRNPYELDELRGKYGLWCNNDDFICGSSRNLLRNSGHLRYGQDGTMDWVFSMVDKKIKSSSIRRVAKVAASNSALDDFAFEDISAPQDIKYYLDDNKITLSWSDSSPAKYLYVKLNGYPLGLVDLSQKAVEIRDVEFDELQSLGFAYVDDELNVGDETSVDLRDENGELKFMLRGADSDEAPRTSEKVMPKTLENAPLEVNNLSEAPGEMTPDASGEAVSGVSSQRDNIEVLESNTVPSLKNNAESIAEESSGVSLGTRKKKTDFWPIVLLIACIGAASGLLFWILVIR